MFPDSIAVGVVFFSLVGTYTVALLTLKAWRRYQIVLRWGNTLPRRMNAQSAFCNLLQLSVVVTCLSVMMTTGLVVSPEDRGPGTLFLLEVTAFFGWGGSILLALRMYRYQQAMDKVLSEPVPKEVT